MSWIKPLAFWSLLVILALVLVEVSAWLFLVASGNNKSFYNVVNNSNNTHAQTTSNCIANASSYKLHPYFGFIQSNCVQLNELGFWGRALERDDTSIYRVGIFGGSVANQFAGVDGHKSAAFEQLLNSCFTSPKGGTFRTINLAGAAWKHPQQEIALMLFGNEIDLALSIEGFNEHFTLKNLVDLSVPANTFFHLANRGVGANLYLNYVEALGKTTLNKMATPRLFAVIGRKWLSSQQNHENAQYSSANYIYQASAGATHNRETVYHNVTRYKAFVADFAALAKARKIPYLQVLQPFPNGKSLTPKEEKVITYRAPDDYLHMVRESMSTSQKFLDLSQLFIHHEQQIFGDSIHFLQPTVKAQFGHTFGDRQMALKIANKLQQMPETGIKRKLGNCEPISWGNTAAFEVLE
ncbi:hypothetical protein [Polycladidibacter stylochi]|uniref:hypothetical protein n=1 Tax=Polycladidibacter stylochi TaxID=1807766 RepID=UPI0008348FB7|nr:hypothetical protein [Pseudovibrio stylochi]